MIEPQPPQPIGPATQFVIRRALTQRQYLDDKQEVQECAALVRVELIAREVRIPAMDEFSPRLTEIAAEGIVKDPELELLNESAERLRGEVAAMNIDNFVVRPKRHLVETFSKAEAWEKLSVES